MASVATGGKKWLKKPKPEANEMELLFLHHWTRLDELIILVWSNVKIGQKMTNLWAPKDCPKLPREFDLCAGAKRHLLMKPLNS